MTEPWHAHIVPIMQARMPVEIRLEAPPPLEELPIREALAGAVYVTYAVETPERLEYVTARHCARLGIHPDALRAQAAGNLRALRPELAMSWDGDTRVVSVGLGRDLEAGLLLDDALMDKLVQDVDGDLVVAVPARTLLLATGTGHHDGLAKLRETIRHVWGAPVSSKCELLTRDLLVRRGGSWDVLDPA